MKKIKYFIPFFSLLLCFAIPVSAVSYEYWYAIDADFADALTGTFTDMGDLIDISFTGISSADISIGSNRFSVYMRDFDSGGTYITEQYLSANIKDSFRYRDSDTYVFDGFIGTLVACYTTTSPFDSSDQPSVMPSVWIRDTSDDGSPVLLATDEVVNDLQLDVSFVGAQVTESDGFYSLYLVYDIRYDDNLFYPIDGIAQNHSRIEITDNSVLYITFPHPPNTANISQMTYSYGLTSGSCFFNGDPPVTLPDSPTFDTYDPWSDIEAPSTDGIFNDSSNSGIWSAIYGLDLIDLIWVPIMISGITIFMLKIVLWKSF